MRKIFAAKGRPAAHPLIVHLPDSSQRSVAGLARFPTPRVHSPTAFWPGPLTLVLPRAQQASDVVTGGQDSVGLRVPSHPVARDLLAAFDGGIAAPSANRFGRISPTTARHVADDLGGAVAMILDGGPCAVGIESTIVAFVGDDPVLLRPGGISAADLARVLGRAPRGPDAVRAARLRHAAVSLRAENTGDARRAGALRAEIAQLEERDEDIAVLARTVPRPADFSDVWRQAPADAAAYAHDLYANLRALDAANADVILIEMVPDDDAWLAVRDRLTRAARGEDDDRD